MAFSTDNPALALSMLALVLVATLAMEAEKSVLAVKVSKLSKCLGF